MAELTRGILIAVEGFEGSGKSTLARSLGLLLSQQQLPVHLTKEPGGTPLGIIIRKIVQEQTTKICPLSEFLLFAADRAQHMQELIGPLLEQKYIVISDRLSDSSVAYQGYGRGLDISMIQQVNSWALQGRVPDVTIYLKIDAKTALDRVKERNMPLTAFEQEKQDFFERVIRGFDQLYKDRNDVMIVDATQQPEEVSKKVYHYIITWLTTQKLFL